MNGVVQGELEFYVNGVGQGVAALNMPSLLYAVVDMYGKCAQVTLTQPSIYQDFSETGKGEYVFSKKKKSFFELRFFFLD